MAVRRSKILGRGRSIKPNTGLKGMDVVLRNLNREIKGIKDRGMAGLLEAVALIRYDMDQTSPMIPVDTGNLRASWFVVTAKSQTTAPSFDNKRGDANELATNYKEAIGEAKGRIANRKIPVVVFGFSANYAAPVHEMPDYYNFQKEGSGPKFMEAAIKRNKDAIISIIHKNVRIR